MKSKTEDPRKGVASCSELGRLEMCPASWPLSKKATALGLIPPAGPDADAGMRVHKAIETADYSGLKESEIALAELCFLMRVDLQDDYFGPNALTAKYEHRLGLTNSGDIYTVECCPHADYLVTGQADFVAWNPSNSKSALIVDYKTGRGDQEHAKSNAQLRGLAVLWGMGYGLQNVRVAIVQPLAGEPTVADYDRAAIRAARDWLLMVVNRAMDSNGSDPKPGDHCRYCPARALCPAIAGEAAQATSALQIPEVLPPVSKEARELRAQIRQNAMELPGEILGRLLNESRRINWMIEAAESAARKRLEAGEDIPGWELGEKAGNRVIEDVDAASKAVAPLLVNAEGGVQTALLRCASLSASDLTSEIRKAAGKTGRKYHMSEREAKDALAAALGDLMDRNMKKTLQRKDETPEIEAETLTEQHE